MPEHTETRTPEDLDKLSTRELHDRAMHRAEKHLDVRFFWSLLETIPAAEAVSGDLGEADFDIVSARGALKDALHSGDGELAEALRPVFIDYLRKHPDA
ncbi:MAG TPA: hypothetical protein VFV03_03875 [Solirubrobacteraceae bacterium]|nr:hypothetical protein [Solirubrobacteraceae bacterium]